MDACVCVAAGCEASSLQLPATSWRAQQTLLAQDSQADVPCVPFVCRLCAPVVCPAVPFVRLLCALRCPAAPCSAVARWRQLSEPTDQVVWVDLLTKVRGCTRALPQGQGCVWGAFVGAVLLRAVPLGLFLKLSRELRVWVCGRPGGVHFPACSVHGSSCPAVHLPGREHCPCLPHTPTACLPLPISGRSTCQAGTVTHCDLLLLASPHTCPACLSLLPVPPACPATGGV